MLDYRKNTQDWNLFLERQIDIFFSSVITTVYGSWLKDATGFGFTHQLNVFNNGIVSYYKTAQELEKADGYYWQVIRNNTEKLDEWTSLAQECNEQTESLIEEFKESEKPLQDIVLNYTNNIDQTRKTILYGTVIPYRILSAIDTHGKQHMEDEKVKKALALFEPLRAYVKYPDITKYIYGSFFKALAHSVEEYEPQLFSYLTFGEFNNVVHDFSTFNLQEIEKRKEWCMYWYDFEAETYFFNYDKNYSNDIGLQTEDLEEKTEFSGSIAQKGIVQGVVRIVNDLKDVTEFNKGDILVSINTNPSLMPVLKDAGAIITDEGGIMCHASIISRELHIPCVIGTKIATKTLKNGDVVEVNADEGIIKKL